MPNKANTLLILIKESTRSKVLRTPKAAPQHIIHFSIQKFIETWLFVWSRYLFLSLCFWPHR